LNAFHRHEDLRKIHGIVNTNRTNEQDEEVIMNVKIISPMTVQNLPLVRLTNTTKYTALVYWKIQQ
jgi:hypothetical protein